MTTRGPDHGAELAEGPGPLRDRDPEERLAGLAQLGPLGHEPEAVEVHVGAAQDGGEAQAAHVARAGPGLEARDRERARRLHHAARVVEDVLDGGADLVVRDPDHLVHVAPRELEGQLAHLAHRDPVREDPDVVERHAVAGRERPVHRVGLVGLDPHDLHPWHQGLDVAGDAGDEAAAAHRHEHRVELAPALAQDLLADRALARDHEGVVEGRDGDEPALAHEDVAVGLGVGIAVAREDHLGAQVRDRLHLDLGGGLGHDDDRAQRRGAGPSRRRLGRDCRRSRR